MGDELSLSSAQSLAMLLAISWVPLSLQLFYKCIPPCPLFSLPNFLFPPPEVQSITGLAGLMPIRWHNLGFKSAPVKDCSHLCVWAGTDEGNSRPSESRPRHRESHFHLSKTFDTLSLPTFTPWRQNSFARKIIVCRKYWVLSCTFTVNTSAFI